MNLDELVDYMKERGLRMTPQRMEILKLLLSMSHPTAEQLFARMHEQFPFVSQATVYNTLKTLKELGIVEELERGQRTHRYGMASGSHCHFVCKVCEEIFDLDAEAPDWTRNLPAEQGGFRIDDCRMELTGVCPGCLEKAGVV
ncbi:Fur family transcriptional regulator [Cohnella lubricantis]|uniref:Transcriptional repressor n=1 Tax=Cohnella lubricantis TaxID=2163172 RepID=A0A841T4R5_9BACL|nr:Fur family transcriptional regulator [Cohnella lubricantis]MBB6676324.1 transcriptional repressor [Cohnella lubricantis]MBP2120307.1 Fur family peroxide stress response transcriptional regulator [Cohnella lubricantis]